PCPSRFQRVPRQGGALRLRCLAPPHAAVTGRGGRLGQYRSGFGTNTRQLREHVGILPEWLTRRRGWLEDPTNLRSKLRPSRYSRIRAWQRLTIARTPAASFTVASRRRHMGKTT